MEKKFIITFITVTIILSLALYILTSNNQEKNLSNSEYENILSQIKRGNTYIIENGITDSCFPYRYYHRGCYYEDKLKFQNGLIISTFNDENISLEQKTRLCYEFIFNGSTAYCLQRNNQITDCLNFAKDDEYLIRICGLKEGEIIPTEGFFSPEYKENPLPDRVFPKSS
jgi:hypothetical protein